MISANTSTRLFRDNHFVQPQKALKNTTEVLETRVGMEGEPAGDDLEMKLLMLHSLFHVNVLGFQPQQVCNLQKSR